MYLDTLYTTGSGVGPIRLRTKDAGFEGAMIIHGVGYTRTIAHEHEIELVTLGYAHLQSIWYTRIART